jgi:hypothetical protein
MPIDSGSGTQLSASPEALKLGSNPTTALDSFRTLIPLLAAILIFAGLATALAMTKAPWCDEGAFANPAYNLAFHGKMGANVLNPSGHFLNAYLKGIQERTYIVVPNHLVALAGWYRLFGFSLMTTRAYSILWGAAALPILFYIFRKLIPHPGVAQLATLLTSIDFVYLWSSADGRMESSANALALGSIAAYLYWRESDFGRAIWISQVLSAAAVFTHPNAILTQLIVGVLIWRFDRAQLRWRHVVFAGVPYAAFGLMWSVYILQSPSDFTAQFLSNAAGRHASRLMAIIQPWTAVRSELIRHVGVYSASGLWTGVMNQWLLLIPVIYAISLIAFFRNWKTYGPTVRAFLLSVVAMMLGMTFLNGFKALMYMAYILPLYCAVLAFGLVKLWNEGPAGRIMAMTAGCGFAALQVLASVEHIKADEYHRDYQKAIAFLRPEQAKGKSIVGTAALGFGLGFTGFEDDWRLGLYSHLDPDVVVMDRSYRYFTEQFERDEPLVFSHVVSSLTTNYRLAGRFGTFWVFERATLASTTQPSTTQAIDVKAMAMKEKGKQAEYLFEQLERSIAAPGNSSIKDTSIHAEIRP